MQHIHLFTNPIRVNLGMIGRLLACIKFKQKPLQWLVLTGLLFLRVTHHLSHRLDIARHGQGGLFFFSKLLMSLGTNREK